MRQIVSDPRAREKPCLRCGRSLKKNLDDRHCPDCGLSLWISLNPNDSLEWSNARWLHAAAQGAWVLAAAQLIAIAAAVAAIVGYAAVERALAKARAGEAGDPGSTGPAYDAVEYDVAAYAEAYYAATSVPVAVAVALIGLHFLVSALGLLRLSVHERRFPDRSKSARVWARIAAGVSAAVGVGMIALALPRLGPGWPVHSASSWLVRIACQVTFAGSACCAWVILRRVARRAGRGTLAKLCGWLIICPAIAPLINLLWIAYLPASVYLFVRFALLLRRAVPAAERAWAAETRAATAAASLG